MTLLAWGILFRWGGAVLGALGSVSITLIRRPTWAMKLWIPANILLSIGGLIVKDWPSTVLFLFYLVISVIGHFNWRNGSNKRGETK